MVCPAGKQIHWCIFEELYSLSFKFILNIFRLINVQFQSLDTASCCFLLCLCNHVMYCQNKTLFYGSLKLHNLKYGNCKKNVTFFIFSWVLRHRFSISPCHAVETSPQCLSVSSWRIFSMQPQKYMKPCWCNCFAWNWTSSLDSVGTFLSSHAIQETSCVFILLPWHKPSQKAVQSHQYTNTAAISPDR